LVGAFFVELLQPSAALVRVHDFLCLSATQKLSVLSLFRPSQAPANESRQRGERNVRPGSAASKNYKR
jgi:hypothetical protein